MAAREPLPCPARPTWRGSAARRKSRQSRARVKSALRGESSTEINLVRSGADGARSASAQKQMCKVRKLWRRRRESSRQQEGHQVREIKELQA